MFLRIFVTKSGVFIKSKYQYADLQRTNKCLKLFRLSNENFMILHLKKTKTLNKINALHFIFSYISSSKEN